MFWWIAASVKPKYNYYLLKSVDIIKGNQMKVKPEIIKVVKAEYYSYYRLQ